MMARLRAGVHRSMAIERPESVRLPLPAAGPRARFDLSASRRACYPFAKSPNGGSVLSYHGKYAAPEDILRDADLSRAEKIRMLEQWRDDKKAYMRASGEGMEGEDRADLLKRIKKALALLQE